MKIMLAVHGFPPNQIGGAEWRTHRTARWLKRRGHMVQVVAVDDIKHPEPGLHVYKDQIDGIDVTRLSFNSSKIPTWRYKNPLMGDYLKARLCSDPPDVFHLISGFCNTGSAIQAAQDAGISVIVTLTEYYWLCLRNTLLRNTGELCHCPDSPLECLLCLYNRKPNRKLLYPLLNRATGGIYGKILLWASEHAPLRKKMGIPDKSQHIRQWRGFLKQMVMRADKLIAPSRFLRDMYIASGIPKELLVFCRQGLDSSLWNSARPEEYHGPLRFGYIGQIVPHKGLDILIQAFTQLDFPAECIRLNIFGKIDEHSIYQQQLRQLSIKDERIHFLGGFDNREIPSVFFEIDVLIVPSVCYENSPNVILEAYACKTPVIASDHSGMAELVKRDICGDLFKLRDVKGLRAILHRIAAQPSILAQWRMGIPNIKLIEEEISELEGIYSSVVSKNS